MIKVYIASPYTIGDIDANVKRQIDCANELIWFGFAPFVPLLFHFQHTIHPQAYTIWTKLDLEWLSVCDCVLRLDGESEGSDSEVRIAILSGKKVFYSINKLKAYYDGKR